MPDRIYVQNFDTSLKKTAGRWWYKGAAFNGYIVETTPDSKTVLYQLPVINGKEEGEASGRYNSGEKLLVRHFKNGKKEGEFLQWWPNGKYRYLFHYTNDIMNGQQLVFYPSGQKRQESNYAMGREEGMQRVWNEKGQLISNYAIRNKRLYGVMAVKSCLPIVH